MIGGNLALVKKNPLTQKYTKDNTILNIMHKNFTLENHGIFCYHNI